MRQRKRRKERLSKPPPGEAPHREHGVFPRVDENREWLKKTLGSEGDLVLRELRTGRERGLPVLLAYIDGLVDTVFISEALIEPLLAPYEYPVTRTNAVTLMEERLISVADVQRLDTLDGVVEGLLRGQTMIFADGCRQALSCDTAKAKARGVEEPVTEPVARGPREGFTELLVDNLSMVRRRLRTPNLRVERFSAGRETQVSIALIYIDGIIAPPLVEEARRRLGRIDENIDGILLSEEIEEIIEDHPFALFPTIGSTERPERVAAALLEGRFGIVVDGSPFVLMAPSLFWELVITTEDYTVRPPIATLNRFLRVVSLMGSLFLPSLYVALVSFHIETLPTPLLLSIATGREGVPFPAVAEALLMEGAFEILREAGLRLPRPIGGAVSIVGVLVVGQAAVAAGIVSPLMIIVVGATAIASFSIPSYSAANTLRLLRFPILLLAGAFGAVGITMSFIVLTLHLVSLRSFGVPFFTLWGPFSLQGFRDTVFRFPTWARGLRPPFFTKNRIRSNPGLKPMPPKGDESGGAG